MPDTNIAIVGAGPYGLAAAAHLRRSGAEVRIIGDPMSFWRTMPAGMLLRSNWSATCIAEYAGPLSLTGYFAATGARFGRPVPLQRFTEYGMWVQQQVAPDVDSRQVQLVEASGPGFRLRFADGDVLHARRVVVAAGIAPFASIPPVAAHLPPGLASHTGAQRDLSRFAGARVLVIGGGQSALESAALLHENGAEAAVAVREDHLHWLHGGKYHRRLGRLAPLVYAPTDVGPMGLSRLVAVPPLFCRLPRRVQDPLAYRSIRPAGAAWLTDRLRDVPVELSQTVASATVWNGRVRVTFADGGTRVADHLLFGTGYRVNVTRYPFLAPSLLARLTLAGGGYPVLARGLESSVPGLHFIGAPAAWSFGPIMRFVSGGWYAGRALARAASGRSPAAGPGRAEPAPVMAGES